MARLPLVITFLIGHSLNRCDRVLELRNMSEYAVGRQHVLLGCLHDDIALT